MNGVKILGTPLTFLILLLLSHYYVTVLYNLLFMLTNERLDFLTVQINNIVLLFVCLSTSFMYFGRKIKIKKYTDLDYHTKWIIHFLFVKIFIINSASILLYFTDDWDYLAIITPFVIFSLITLLFVFYFFDSFIHVKRKTKRNIVV